MNKEITWHTSHFGELTATQLYDILHLRCKIFVVEQDCAYLDIDNKDQKALHLYAYLHGKPIAYCRLFNAGDYFDQPSIGRVIVDADYRKLGLGHQMMDKAINIMRSELHAHQIVISGQLYLKHFYESHGFMQISDQYLEDGIPHIRMQIEAEQTK